MTITRIISEVPIIRLQKAEKVKKSKTHKQLISVNLIDKIKEFEQFPPKITGFTISRIEYLIHLILSHKQENHPGSWSVLNMKYMLNVVPRANEYLNLLREKNIIKWKNHSKDRNSRLYRLYRY